MSEYRSIRLLSTPAEVRTEVFEGITYTVVPVVALVEGVIQAMNAPSPELVPADAFSFAPGGWNGRPVFLGHPLDSKGNPISGNTPEVLTNAIGRIFNAKFEDAKLKMEAWLDPIRCAEVGGDAAVLIDRIATGQVIEVSVGAFISLVQRAGTWAGKKFVGAWDTIVPDHLALLPAGAKGACSVEMGCGTPRVASAFLITAEGYREAEENDYMSTKTTEAKPNEPEAPRGLRQRLAGMVRQLLSNDMSDTDVRDELREALKEKEPALDWIIEVYPNRVIYCTYEGGAQRCWERAYTEQDDDFTLGDNRVEVEEVRSWEPVLMKEKPEEPTAAAGARHSKKDQGMVQAMHDHSVALGAACAAPKAAAQPCGCGTRAATATADNINEGVSMTRKERVSALAANPHSPVRSQAALEACSDDELLSLETQATAAKKTADDAAAAAARAASTPAPAPAAPAPPTTEEWMRTAPPEVRDLVARHQAAERAAQTRLVGVLKSAQKVYTEAELQAMSVDSLTKLATLACPEAINPTTSVVDFSGLGLPRAAEETTDDSILNPPNGYLIALEARNGGQKGQVN